MVAVIIIAVIVVPVVAYYIGKEFEYIANEKGYTSKKYFWWTFLFGAVGISMVIALPDRRGGTGAASSGLPMSDDEIPESMRCGHELEIYAPLRAGRKSVFRRFPNRHFRGCIAQG